MAAIPNRVVERLSKAIKRFQPILTTSKGRDDGEADTAMIVTEMLAEVFGYDKFSEITAEYAIRSTWCDLATKIDGTLQSLIEVKAIGLELKDQHVKQAVDYAANQGIDYVVLTNAVTWRVYKVVFEKPINQDLIIEFDFCSLSPKKTEDLEKLYLFCKEGWTKSVIGEYQIQKQALSRFFIAATVLSDPVLNVIRRELKRLSPDVRIDTEQIAAVLQNEVIKREVMEGDKADEARKKIARTASKTLRKIKETDEAKAKREHPTPPPVVT